jgi:chromosome segregation ATPase
MVLDDVRTQHSEAAEHFVSSQHQHTEQMRSSRAEHETLHCTQQHMRDVLVDLEISVTHLKEQKINLQHDLEALRATEHAHTSEACSLATQQLAQGRAALVECTQALAQKDEEIAGVQAQLSQLCRTLDEKQLALIQLGLACEERECQSTKVHECAQLELNEAQASLAQCICSISDKSAELVQMEEQIGQKRAVSEGMTAEMCQHQKSLLDYAAGVSEKEAELIRLQAELQNTLVEVDNKHAEATALHAQGVSVHAELSDAQQQLNNCKQELQEYQDDLAECITEVDGMEECVAKHKVSAATLQAQQNVATEQYAACQEEITQHMAQLDALEQDLLHKKDSLHATHTALQAGEKHAEEQQELCVAVAQKHSEGVARLQQIQDEIARCTAELQVLHARITSSNTGTTCMIPKINTQNADDDEFEAMLMSLADADVALNDSPNDDGRRADDTASQHALQSPNTATHQQRPLEMPNTPQMQQHVLQQNTLCMENSTIAADLQMMCAEFATHLHEQRAATCDDQCALRSPDCGASDANDLVIAQQHMAELAVEVGKLTAAEDGLKARNLEMSAVLLEVQVDIARHKHASAELVSVIETQEQALQDAVNAVLVHQQQHTATCDELCDLQSQISAARDELVAKNADLMILQQHIAQHGVDEKHLQEQSSEMSAALQEVQTGIVQHEHTSRVLVAAIKEQETALHAAENAVLVSQQERTTKSDEMLAMQQKTEALNKKYSKSKKELARVQLQTKEASEAHATIQVQMQQDSDAVVCTQNDLQESVLRLEAAQVEHEAGTAQHLAQQAQQLAQCNEMQASVDCMMHNKQRIIESIEVLSLSNAEYEQKLHKIQHYSNSLNMSMNLLRDSMHMHTRSAEFHVNMEAILDLFGSFLDWFESTFTTRLYDFSCLLLNSRVE